MREENHTIEFKSKTIPINVRIDENELQTLKNTASQHGVGYSVIVKSLIYKFNRNLINFL
ncbi:MULTISPECIES: CopG family transcriptional regulator [unclassified Francisella]|uniref:CopG family transcriptional regulator n=1 Tax=unclassified Francisella TaxID=2610885 RepID=UPI002E30EEE5|nr:MULTISPECIES: CopG family transcriptional regulator [unclassified Francisella]MED7820139.1 CopG family transcriptional regulator [Francisella sp. 19S2-4]MED7830959.1 CopG family transcriptional regulator [Francisella sp. 19S2-10]